MISEYVQNLFNFHLSFGCPRPYMTVQGQRDNKEHRDNKCFINLPFPLGLAW